MYFVYTGALSDFQCMSFFYEHVKNIKNNFEDWLIYEQ